MYAQKTPLKGKKKLRFSDQDRELNQVCTTQEDWMMGLDDDCDVDMNEPLFEEDGGFFCASSYILFFYFWCHLP